VKTNPFHIAIVGTGNVAFHLCKALSSVTEFEVKIHGRNSEERVRIQQDFGVEILETVGELNVWAELIILAISDGSISEFSEQLSASNALVVHTSGAANITDIQSTRRGVFYPLQTFTKEKEIKYSNIPFFLEAENESDKLILKQVSDALDAKSYLYNSEERLKLHTSAVLVSNFVNALLHGAENVCANKEVFNLLQPLVEETVEKAFNLGSRKAQTGPAIRKDEKTIEKHLEVLNDFPEEQKVYSHLTQYIQSWYD
jgi:predicted short-subunit dehydrogenase-like oxidoreductase (DUF2520 family)